MTDVGAMMRAIESMHDCRVEFHVRTLTRQPAGAIAIVCDATFERLPDSELPKRCRVEHSWPSKVASTFDGLLYNLLWQLDLAIQQAYEQAKFPEK